MKDVTAGLFRTFFALGLTGVLFVPSTLISCASGGDAAKSGSGNGGSGAVDGGDANAGAAGGTSTGGSGGSSTGGNAGVGGGVGGIGGFAGGFAGSAGAGGTTTDGGDASTAGAAGMAGFGGAAGAAGSGGSAGAGGTCETQPEVCNGLDDNCNDIIDEGDPGGGDPCTVSGQLGVCAEGILMCDPTLGAIVCDPLYTASPEECNGLDDNCSGAVDEGNPGGNVACDTGELGICRDGTTNCENGALVCNRVNSPQSQEFCNGLDDDCDGSVDEDFAGAGDPCVISNLLGPCAQGQTTCSSSGQNGCAQVVFPSAEVCDLVDNDCDGQVDNNAQSVGDVCDTGLLGECRDGIYQCNGGNLTCAQTTFSATETCNNLDDDCDGTVDNNLGQLALNSECLSKQPNAVNVNDWQCVAGFCGITSCLSGYQNCDGSPGNGCEVDLSSSALHCGSCQNACNQTNGTAGCSGGQCVIYCNSGYGNCDSDTTNGCETLFSSDINNCGGCGNACSNTNGSTTCQNGACVPVCNAGFADCDGDKRNGCETNLNTSTNNCGACGAVCFNANGSTSCSGGGCVPSCNTGFGNCDGNDTNGCETNTNTSTGNCGACGTQCVNPGGSTSCVSGSCSPVCGPNSGDCDGNPINGCETNTGVDINNCGICGRVCSNAHGTTSCSGGQCNPSCNTGYADCDGDPSNGCEVDIRSDVSHCGDCTTECYNSNGTTTCTARVCVPNCAAGFADCDGNPVNGCETNINTSTTHCGSCTTVCTNPNGNTSCVGGSCTPVCSSGYADCTNPNDGCETNTNTSLQNCGGCGQLCDNPTGTENCVGGTCQIGCNIGYADCDGDTGNGCEKNVSSDPANCGGCGLVCTNPNGSTSCTGGVCVPSCSSGYGNCDGVAINGCETDLRTNVNYCGSCSIQCFNDHGTTQCTAGSCSPQCASGWGDCDGNPINGCETSLTSLANCGACGAACALANAGESCATGTCVITTCAAGYNDCDGQDANGCEAQLSSDTSNCGTCGLTCTNAHGSTACSGGTCSPTCSPSNYASCDGNANNGCETNLNTSVNNCGGCGNTCSGTPQATGYACSGGSCTITSCQSGYYDMDGSYANGCECQADSVSNSCSTALDLGTVTIDGPPVVGIGNITPGTDVDWYKVTFQSGATCGYSPTILLEPTNPADLIRFQALTGCSASGLPCAEGGTSDDPAGFERYEFLWSAACGDLQSIDPTPATTGSFLQAAEAPTTVYIKVFSLGSSSTCQGYTLTVSN